MDVRSQFCEDSTNYAVHKISSINICDSFSLYASSFFDPGRVTQLPINSATSFGPISKMRLQKLNDPKLVTIQNRIHPRLTKNL